MTNLLFAAFNTIASAAFFGLNLPWFGFIWGAIAVLNGVCFLIAKDEQPGL